MASLVFLEYLWGFYLFMGILYDMIILDIGIGVDKNENFGFCFKL